MSAESTNLFSMARSKLQVAVGGKDNCNLHRWVLLKNSIFRSSTPAAVHSSPSSTTDVNSVYIPEDDGDGDDEDEDDEETDSFMFPDASDLVVRGGPDVNASEAEWLDSLLETLCEGGEDEFSSDRDISVTVVPVDDDEDASISPLLSPMSSSDDLLNQHAYCPPPISVPYPVPYPPFHPPLIHPYELGPVIESPLYSSPPAYDALPYYDTDELDDLSVPEAIEDTSDDESDAPLTPSLGRSSDLYFVDPASVPLPGERRRRRSQPHVYIRTTTDSYLDRFQFDPLPFPGEDHFPSYNDVYQAC
ncbi:hypothetical protein BV22DRAFT_1066479 [Leucogyrophana mollusca]|uniref:Uncharacterized protein n=1 Tax=Leucogyrophana mollusca TaxID=85980 RepID=A0ACB8BGH6_9AGAM|nr:hypothetical protein BV22DRAFT_1066479 [Leucogyrophana mollusca]